MRGRCVQPRQLLAFTMHTIYFIKPTAGRLRNALASWQWIGLSDKKPILVTAFADVFLRSGDGVWFLDTLEGTMRRVCATRRHLDKLLATSEGREVYLRASLVERANREARKLGEGQCYEVRGQPGVGRAYAYDDVERTNFVVSLHIRGQMHDQLQHHACAAPPAPGRQANGDAASPWWKFW